MPHDTVDEAIDYTLAEYLDIAVVDGNISPAKSQSKGVGNRGGDKQQRKVRGSTQANAIIAAAAADPKLRKLCSLGIATSIPTGRQRSKNSTNRNSSSSSGSSSSSSSSSGSSIGGFYGSCSWNSSSGAGGDEQPE